MNSTTLIPFSSYRNGGTHPSELETGISTLFREIDQFFDSPVSSLLNNSLNSFSRTPLRTHIPEIDILETEENINLTAELPGMEDKDIEISLENEVLTLKGKKKYQSDEKEMQYHRMERSYGAFQRNISLPAEIQADEVRASFRNGVLTVTLPKTPSAKERMKKIPITTESTMNN